MTQTSNTRRDRRTFLKTTSMTAGSLIIMGTKATAGIKGANDRVRIAVAGLNGRGQSHIGGWMGSENTQIAYAIDPDHKVLANRMKSIESRTDGKFETRGVADFREALDDSSLD